MHYTMTTSQWIQILAIFNLAFFGGASQIKYRQNLYPHWIRVRRKKVLIGPLDFCLHYQSQSQSLFLVIGTPLTNTLVLLQNLKPTVTMKGSELPQNLGYFSDYETPGCKILSN